MKNLLDKGPLSEAEIDELDRFLMHAEGVEESMDIATLDGFFTAIICGPKTILPSEWLRWVWDFENGKESPRFENAAQAQHVFGLLMRYMNGIAGTLDEAPEEFEPLLMENPNDGDPILILDEWCSGFMKGVELDAEGWQPLVSGKPDWMSTLWLYGTDEGWEALEQKNLSLDQHRALAEGLTETIRKIHGYWLEHRREQAAQGVFPGVMRREPVRKEEKVGRNDPCPCGSGRKFKKCHGSPERLH